MQGGSIGPKYAYLGIHGLDSLDILPVLLSLFVLFILSGLSGVLDFSFVRLRRSQLPSCRLFWSERLRKRGGVWLSTNDIWGPSALSR